MKIKFDDSLFHNLEALSMLKLKKNEREIIKKDIKNILKYLEILDELDTSNEEEMITPFEKDLNLREDRIYKSEDISTITKEFPERKDSYIKIPAIYNNE